MSIDEFDEVSKLNMMSEGERYRYVGERFSRLSSLEKAVGYFYSGTLGYSIGFILGGLFVGYPLAHLLGGVGAVGCIVQADDIYLTHKAALLRCLQMS